jgi:hypothetical protein
MLWPEAVALTAKLLAGGACGVGLWWTWKITVAEFGALERAALTSGFLLRALGGACLFWLSYLGLRIGRPLQIGDGLWWFGLDAYEYMRLARQAVETGPLGIATLSTTTASVIFVQALATLMAIVGPGAGAGLLLNCGSFLVGSLMLARWGREVGSEGRAARAFAVFTVSLCPSWILWATQPLKDALFAALVLAWFFVSAVWLSDDPTGVNAARRRLGIIAILGVLLYSVAGIRAYFALILWLGLGAGLVLRSVPGPQRRFRRVAVEWCVWALLSQVITLAAAPYLPRPARWLIVKSWVTHQKGAVPIDSSISVAAIDAKRGFVQAGGATLIKPGGGAEPPVPVDEVASVVGRPQGGSVPGTSSRAAAGGKERRVEAPVPADEVASVGGRPQGGGVEKVERMSPGTSSITAAKDERRSVAQAQGALRSIGVGFAALFLPRFGGEALGLLHIGGGQGFWAFAEIDTLFFTLAAIVSSVLTIRAVRRRRGLTAAALQVIVSACLVTVALAFVVTNFGTLFRLREMILVCFAVLPLAASGRNGGGGDSSVE